MHRPLAQDPAGADASLEALQHALRELHAPSLLGFALLLTIGDRRRSISLTSDALAAADAHAGELRHPERAAAWLRARVVAAFGRRDSRIDAHVRLDALAALGVSSSVLAGLAALGPPERAALIASLIERLDDRDVATIVGRGGDRLDALLRRARQGFLDGCAAAPDGPPRLGGPLTDLVHAAAARAMT